VVSVAWLETARPSVDARTLVRRELSRAHPEIAPSTWTFARTEAGKPFVTGPITEGHLAFNLSHTDRLAAVAVGPSDVGIDVEALARGADILDTVLRAFAAEEVAALRALPTAEHEPRAVELWTVKEAYLKGIGTGISRHLDRFAVAPLRPGLWAIEEAPNWRVHTKVVGRWMLAVAADANEAIAYRGEGGDQVR
jgi:4'-phosphopantetheinyl transferase